MRALLAAVLLVAACGGGPKARARDVDFKCGGRRVEYIATGTMMYAEQGIRLTCDGDRATLTRYFTTAQGKETKQTGEVSVSAWERGWHEFDAAGWRFLGDCEQQRAVDEREPLYTFEITNGDLTKSFRCQGNELPFPYEAMRNALDMAAAELPEQTP